MIILRIKGEGWKRLASGTQAMKEKTPKKPRVIRQKQATHERVVKNKKIYNRKKEKYLWLNF